LRSSAASAYTNTHEQYRLFPISSPLSQSPLFRYTPSNSTNTSREAAALGIEKAFRYQPTPPGSAPPAGPARFVSLNAPSMLQSCGTSSSGQPESGNVGSCAPATSPR